MLGQIGLPGGGIGYGYGAIGAVGVSVKRLEGLTFPQGAKSDQTISSRWPALPIMLLNPGEVLRFQRPAAQVRRHSPWSTGVAVIPFHHHQDLNRLQQASSNPKPSSCTNPGGPRRQNAPTSCCRRPRLTNAKINGRAMGDSYLFHMPKMIRPCRRGARRLRAFLANWHAAWVSEQAFTEDRSAVSNSGCSTCTPSSAQQNERPAASTFPNWTSCASATGSICRCAGPEFARRYPLPTSAQIPQAAPLATPSGRIEISSPKRSPGFDYTENAPDTPTGRRPTNGSAPSSQRTLPVAPGIATTGRQAAQPDGMCTRRPARRAARRDRN